MRSIRSTITLITILVILTSIISVSCASQIIIRNETDENTVDMMNLINDSTEWLLDNYFQSIEQSVGIVANIAVDDLDSVFLVECGIDNSGTEESIQTSEQRKELDEYIDAYCEKLQKIFSGVAGNTQGVIAYYYCIDPQISINEHGFFYMKQGKTGLIEQNPLDVSSLKTSEELGASWYDTAVAMGCPGWIGAYICQGQWVCSYMVPIYKAGMLIGVMGMDISCESLAAQVKDIHLYKTGYVSLMAANERFIYHPDMPIGSKLEDYEIVIAREIINADSSGDKLIRYESKGQKKQLSFSTLSNGMKLFCVVPVKEVNASWMTLLWNTTLITAIIIIFFVFVILFIVGKITKPLEQLTDAAKELADSNYDVDLTYQENNEIGELTSAFSSMRDQIKSNIEDLNHQLYYDQMTDLPNMRKFFTLAVEERNQLREAGKEAVMVYFNIIGIRNYNHQYGFKVGDKLIKNFAKILSQHFGENRVCRFNGDRFTAVADRAEVDKILGEVLKACETAVAGNRLPIRVGIYPDKLEHVNTDIACDRAKYACDLKKGELSSSITYYDEEMLRRNELDLHVIHNLERALDEGWVQVYYQPIVRTANGKVCDEEALVRWLDPELGILYPSSFIPALEQSKLIYRLDLYVVSQVLIKLKKQADAGFHLVSQSINLSRMDFERCDVVEEIRRRVDDAGIKRSLITIEITESTIGSDFEFMKEQVSRFRDMGFNVWMDDFGSGYSSLDVLQQIHFDLIKFDMKFMEDFDDGEDCKIILTHLVNMAINLGMDSLCEGVENEKQVEFLRDIGCTRVQGYYYGKAIPFEEIKTLLQNGYKLEYENPEEADYYTSLGRVNLFDFSGISGEEGENLDNYFNTLPMCVMEVSGTTLWYIRCNNSYRDFLKRTMNVEIKMEEKGNIDLSDDRGTSFFKKVLECGYDGKRLIVDEKIKEDTIVHAFIHRIAVNPVTGISAVAVVVLTVNSETSVN